MKVNYGFGDKVKGLFLFEIFPSSPCFFLYQMVAHFTLRTYGVNQEFRFVEGIWLHRKSSQIRFFFLWNYLFYIKRAQRVLRYHLISVLFNVLSRVSVQGILIIYESGFYILVGSGSWFNYNMNLCVDWKER